jgi:hypothetical protein
MKDLTTPKKYKTSEDLKDKVITLIEKEFDNDSDMNYGSHVHIVIRDEYPTEVRDEVVEDYMKRGWSDVKHQTSTENGERGGLTGFKFYF